MAELLAGAGQAVGEGISGFGQNLQAASGGNFGPLAGQFMPKAATGLIGQIFPENDPTKDPYKPEGAIMYDENLQPKMPEPNKYAGLLSSMSMSSEDSRRQAEEMAKANLARAAYGKFY